MKHCGKEATIHQYDLFKYSFCEVCRKEVAETDAPALPSSNLAKFIDVISCSLKEKILHKFGANFPLSCEIRESTESPAKFFILRNDPLIALSSRITFHLLENGSEVSWTSISLHRRIEFEKIANSSVALWCDDFHFNSISSLNVHAKHTIFPLDLILYADISVEKLWLDNGLSVFKNPPVVINPSP